MTTKWHLVVGARNAHVCLGSQSSDPDLLVTRCTRPKQTAWTEDQFTVTSSSGIRNREKRVADIVVRDLKRDKPGAWGYVQAREVHGTNSRFSSFCRQVIETQKNTP
jgi:hypothetical protein